MSNTEATNSDIKGKGRGGAKAYPSTPFTETHVIGQTIISNGVEGQLRRTRLFDRIGRSPDSGSSRQLIIDSSRYGLTIGGYQAEYIKITPEGTKALGSDISQREQLSTRFELAIRRIGPFSQVYDRISGNRLPAPDVLADLFSDIPTQDRPKCVAVFLQNLRDVGLVQEIAGADRVISLEESLEEIPDQPTTLGTEPAKQASDMPNHIPTPKLAKQEEVTGTTNTMPAVHIDVNIHIDSSASSEQIETIFSSMAKYLYPQLARNDE